MRVGATMGVEVGEFGSELEVSRLSERSKLVSRLSERSKLVSRLSERSKVERRRQIGAGKLELVRF